MSVYQKLTLGLYYVCGRLVTGFPIVFSSQGYMCQGFGGT